MATSLPAIDGPFLYNGDLFADVGNMNRHKRAPVDEIKKLLRPDLKKKGASPPKDPVAHWWEAQLVHYGLPSTKDKARAKMRLLDALNNSSLAVPAAIVTLENNLAKLFGNHNRKKSSGEKPLSIPRGASSRAPTAGTKRKADDATAKSSTISSIAGDAQQVKKTKSTTTKSPPSKSASKHPSLPPPRPLQTARKQILRHHGSQPPYALNRTPTLERPAPSYSPVPAHRPQLHRPPENKSREAMGLSHLTR